jgi:two-component system phosphate regulon sensor histidine kinase PhoR
MWGEAARTGSRRGFQGSATSLVQESEARLQEFLAAIQASPNGMVLLDDEGAHRMVQRDWRPAHFGFGSCSRDLLTS